MSRQVTPKTRSKRGSRKRKTKPQVDAALEEYQSELNRLINSERNLGIHTRVNSALVVAGPQDDVEKFEAIAKSARLGSIGVAPAGLRRQPPTYWRTRWPFSLRSLLRYLQPKQRRRLQPRLPRETFLQIVSRLETVEGRVRVELRFGAEGRRVILERLLKAIVDVHAALSFVLVVIDRTMTEARASLVIASGVEHYRLPRTRCKALVRRESRRWGRDSATALDEATSEILAEGAAHWDGYLASGPEPLNVA